MPRSQYERVSVFREDSMAETDAPKLSPRSSYSTGLEKPTLTESKFNWKPAILRTIPLLMLLALTLGLIGVLEYAIIRLPHGSKAILKRDKTILLAPAHEANVLRRRNETSTISSSSSVSFSLHSTLAYTTATSAYVDSDPTTYYSTATSAFVDTDPTILPSTDTTAFIQPISTETSRKPVTAYQAEPSAYVDEKTTFTTTQQTQLYTADSAYVVSSTIVETLTPDSLLPTAASTETSAYVAPGPTETVPPSYGGDEHAGENEHGASGGHEDNNANEGASDDDTSNFDNQRASLDGGNEVVMKWQGHQVFLGTYLAICVAVLYRLLWIVLYNAFNLIEPFRQLMAREGATADKAFFSFYQSQSALLGPIPALKRKRWALSFIGTAYFIANILPALASECVYVDTDYDCASRDDDNTNNPCFPRMTANATVLRIMQGLLGFAAVIILFTASLLLFNKTGLPTKPNSIAAIASLMRHPRLLADLSDTPVSASAEHMQRLMQGKRYRMGHYTCANGLTGYGIHPLNGYDSYGFASPLGGFKHGYTPVDGSAPFSDRKGESVTLRRFRFQDSVLVFFILGAFGVVLAYFLDGNQDPFNDFFNSNTFGPRFILTLAGTVIASTWRSVEQDAMVMAPYIRLSHRPSSPASTILLTPTSTPLTSTIRSLRNRYFFAATITLVTLFAEALNVVISGVPYASGQTLTQYLVSSYMSLAILGLMILVSLSIIARRFREPQIPRKPNTLGAVMSYLCSSRMLDDFEGTEGLDEKTMRMRFRSLGKKYEFSETVRRDGKLAWAVDEAFDIARC